MTTILTSGTAAMDFVFRVDAMPRQPEKYLASDAAIQGGGGGANAAAAIVRLGGQARFVGRLGHDLVGEMIAASLEEAGVDITFLHRFEDRRSSFASIFIDPAGERQIVSFRDPAMPTGTGWIAQALHRPFDAVLADTRWPEAATVLVEAARAYGRPGVVDVEAPARKAETALYAASHAAFSEQGLRDWSGGRPTEVALADFAAETGRFACVTLGSRGVLWKGPAGEGHVPAFAIDAVDTLGAGDVWHGAFTLMLAEKREEAEAIRFANAAAAIKSTRTGGRSSCPGRDEVEAFLDRT